MVVIGIAAVMVGFTYTGFSSLMERERVRAAAHQLSGNLKRARFMSMEKHVSHSFIFNSSVNTYQLYRDPPPYFDFTDAAANPKIEEIKVDEKFPGVGFTQNFAKSRVRFDIQGISKAGGLGMGTVTFRNRKGFECDVVVSSLGRTRIRCDSDY